MNRRTSLRRGMLAALGAAVFASGLTVSTTVFAAPDGDPGAHKPQDTTHGDCKAHPTPGEHNGYDCTTTTDPGGGNGGGTTTTVTTVTTGGDGGSANNAGATTTVTSTVTQTVTVPAPGTGVLGVNAASPKKCTSRRKFTIRVRRPRGSRLRSARITLRGKVIKTLRGKRITAPITLRGLPKGTFTIRIRAVTTTGKVIVGKRTYRTCVPKRPSSPPPL